MLLTNPLDTSLAGHEYGRNRGLHMVTGWSLSLLVTFGLYVFALLICGLFFFAEVLSGWSVVLSDLASGNWNTTLVLIPLFFKDVSFLFLVSFVALSWARHHRILVSVLSVLPLVFGWPAAQEHLEFSHPDLATPVLWIWKAASIGLLLPPFVFCVSFFRLLWIRFGRRDRTRDRVRSLRAQFTLQIAAHGLLLALLFVRHDRATSPGDSADDFSVDQSSRPQMVIIVAPGLTVSAFAQARGSLSAPNAQFVEQAVSVFAHRPTVPLALPMRREFLTCDPGFRSGLIANSDVSLSDEDVDETAASVLLEAGLRIISFRDPFESLWLWGGRLALEHLVVRRTMESWVDASPVLGVVSAGLYLARWQQTWSPHQTRMVSLRNHLARASKDLSDRVSEAGTRHPVLIELPDLFFGKLRASRQSAALEEIFNLMRDLVPLGLYPTHRLVLLGLPPERVTGIEEPLDSTAAPVLVWNGPEATGESERVGFAEQNLVGAQISSSRAFATFEVRAQVGRGTSVEPCGTGLSGTAGVPGKGLSHIPLQAAERAVAFEFVSLSRSALAERLISAPWSTRTRSLDPILRGRGGAHGNAEPGGAQAGFHYFLHWGAQTTPIEWGHPLNLTDENARKNFDGVFSSLPVAASAGAGAGSVPVELRARRGVLY